MQIYRFNNILKPVLWGGDKLVAFKRLAACDEPIGESWELSAMPGRESVVADGPDKGLSLTELVQRYGAELVGEDVYRRHGEQFPLLIKLIDAKRDLSIQVHPGDEQAMRDHGCMGKTEMWYVLETDEGAAITTGFKRAMSPEEFDRRLADNTILEVLNTVSSHPGDVFYIPSGQIHTIGAGNLLVEVQQSCDVTYRVFDYNRMDSNGQQRELHTALARQALDFAQLPATAANLCPENAESSNLVTCDYFVVDRHKVKGTLTINVPDSFMIIMCIEGSVELEGENMPKVRLSRGQTVLCPACLPQYTLEGCATLLTAHC